MLRTERTGFPKEFQEALIGSLCMKQKATECFPSFLMFNAKQVEEIEIYD